MALTFLDPIDGVIIHTTAAQDGHIRCMLKGFQGQVCVNGVPCAQEGDFAVADILLSPGKQCLEARDESGQTACIGIERVHTEKKLYRVSVDDCIWFLQDIARHADSYKSIFDNPFLAMYQKLHREYGTAFHMNIYLECPEHGGFHLSQMPERFREEWQENRRWLRLSFHAKANLPDAPYDNSGYDTLRSHCAQVMEQIQRFAGDMGTVTTLHFANTTQEGIRALYDCGVRALLGDYELNKQGQRLLCYSHPDHVFDAVRKHVFWRDPETGMIFFPCDVVLNTMTPEVIRREMDRFAAWWPDRNFLDILIHEQYFYPDYEMYEPDYEARLRAGIEWCREQGYSPGLAADVLDRLTD